MGCMNSKVGTKDIDLTVTGEDRKCTDIIWLLLFIVFIVVWIGAGIFAMMFGDPYRVLYAIDYEGNTCGTGGRGKYAYYPRLSDDLFDALMNNPEITNPVNLTPEMIKLYGVCMDTCPEMMDVVCNYDVVEKPSVDQMSEQCSNLLMKQLYPICKQCWIVPLNSADILYRCLWEEAFVETAEEVCEYPPDADVTSTDCVSKKVITTNIALKPAQENSVIDGLSSFGGTISKIMGDMQKASTVILTCGLGVSIVLGFAWLVILQYCAGLMVWTTLWGSVVLSFGFSMFCFYQAGYFTVENLVTLTSAISAATNVTIDTDAAADQFNSSLSSFESKLPDSAVAGSEDKSQWTIGAWVMLVVSIALLCICIGMKKKIAKAIGVLKEASKAVQDIPVVVLYPIFTMSLSIILIGWYLATSAAIKSLGDFSLGSLNVSVDNITDAGVDGSAFNSSGISSGVQAYSESNLSDPLTFFNIFGFLWVYNFIAGIGMMTIAGTIGEWYFTRPPAEGKKDLPNSTLTKAFVRVFRFHLGTIAFGSFIVAVVQMIRVVMEYVDRQTKDLQKANKAIEMLMKVVKCCLYCFEKCIKFLSNNAYILCATRGTAFIPSACKAFKLILANIATIGILNLVASFMMLLGKLFIVFLSVYCGYIWINNDPVFAAATATTDGGALALSNKFIPLGVIGLFAFIMANAFLGIYGQALDTIMLCFCEDMGAFGDNAPDKYYMGSDLRKAMGFKGKGATAPLKDGDDKDAGGDKKAGEKEATPDVAEEKVEEVDEI